jgi:hypothetical protein
MGYSTPKKPLDLKEFLSQPASRRPAKGFGFQRKFNQPEKPAPEADPEPQVAAQEPSQEASQEPLSEPDREA